MKISRLLLVLLPIAANLSARADLAQAEKLLRDKKPAEALAELELEPHSPAALYWKGRALLELKRLPQAVSILREVPPSSVYYPYAAKAIIYSAWQSPALDFVEHVAPLTASSNEEIATLAQAALAEHQLRNTRQGDTSTLEPLRALAEHDASLRPMVQLLNIEEMRRDGRYDEAIAACRKMEADSTLPLIMRQRIRLALAEIYYAKEATPPVTPPDNEDEDVTDEGKGEETLLLFISAHADSPLLEEAFRRLDHHNAFRESEYARRKLEEWSEELTKPHRAAIALAIRQRMQLEKLDSELPEDVTYTNTAATALPNEPISQLIISEQVRRLINCGKTDEAKLYLNMLTPDEENPRYLFYKACCMPNNSKEAVELFRKSAELASTDLQPAALCNAMFYAIMSGEQNVVDELLTKELPPRARRALLLMHAGLILRKNPAQARAEIESAILLEPTTEEQREIVLQLAELDIANYPEKALAELNKVPADRIPTWSHEQQLRFCSLQVQAAEKLKEKNADAPEPTDFLKKAIANSRAPEVRELLTFNLAHRLAEQQRNEEALELMTKLAEVTENAQHRARALLLAGRQAELLNSFEQLDEAASYFGQAAELNTPYKHKAQLLQARVLAWINRIPEAQNILEEQLRNNELSAKERAMALSVKAHVLTLLGTEQSYEDALSANALVFDIKDLPKSWRVRAKIQRASLHARSGKHEEALQDYLALIENTSRNENELNKAEWFVLYFAGAGAVSRYTETKRYKEAAELADRIAGWPHESAPGTRYIGKGHRSEQFANWADNIRKIHFLPGVQTLERP